MAMPLKLMRARDLSGSKYSQSPPKMMSASTSGVKPGRLLMVPVGVCCGGSADASMGSWAERRETYEVDKLRPAREVAWDARSATMPRGGGGER